MQMKFETSGSLTTTIWKVVTLVALTLFLAVALTAVPVATSSFAACKGNNCQLKPKPVTLPKSVKLRPKPTLGPKPVTLPKSVKLRPKPTLGPKPVTLTNKTTLSKKTTKPKAAAKQNATSSRAIKTSTGFRAAGTTQTSFGISKGTSTSFGAVAKGARKTSSGFTSGTGTSFGVVAKGAQKTSTGFRAAGTTQKSFGVLKGTSTSFGAVATGAQKTSTGFIGSGCQKTAFGVSCSDIRLKRDVVALGRLDNGLTLYRFRYKWDDQAYVGVMAQDVRKIAPDAVSRGSDGYLRVNYDRLGLRMQTWNEWSGDNGSIANGM